MKITAIDTLHIDRYTFVQGDIGNYELTRYLFDAFKPAYVVNFAAESHNSRAVLHPEDFYRTNVLGTQQLLQAARDAAVPRFHHISTCEVYGDLPLDTDEVFTEESPYRPRTPYNASKAAADMAVRAYHETFGLATTISNCSNNYGPYQFPEKLIPVVILKALAGAPIPIYGKGDNIRDWLYVIDHCEAIIKVMENGLVGETYNIGGGNELQNIDIVSSPFFSILTIAKYD